MKITKKQSEQKIFDFVKNEAISIAKNHGMKETVHFFEAALISLAIHEEQGNQSSAARSLHTPVTTLGSRKDTLAKKISRMEKIIKQHGI